MLIHFLCIPACCIWQAAVLLFCSLVSHVLMNPSGVQEIAAPLEASVTAPELIQVASEQQQENSLQLCLQPSLALWHALDRFVSQATHMCWQDANECLAGK